MGKALNGGGTADLSSSERRRLVAGVLARGVLRWRASRLASVSGTPTDSLPERLDRRLDPGLSVDDAVSVGRDDASGTSSSTGNSEHV